ncbi:PREDICTED: uncharacterized protein LOC105362640 [Ceratosolen solmsi marchali]|uniref:Uncharacterized protein LOC105362640 n=1 Tax=Ceratosolen solmsi marchali TaxID=326594 RepID=A0AAJ6YI02_9HYME|nr:PREDICTED: uncharacterized protein LOC105362640 [Ceratosolen solmsi marchali]
MNREKQNLDTKRSVIKGKNCPSTGSSDYTSCSDNPIENVSLKKENLNDSLQSVILAGQIQSCYQKETTLEESVVLNVPNNHISIDSNFSVNVLDQNLDVFMDNSDVFMDCTDVCPIDSNDNDSTKYLQFESASKLSKTKSNNSFYSNYLNTNKLNDTIEIHESNDSLLFPIKPHNENDRLITIIEESEVARATNSCKMNKSHINLKDNVKDRDVEIPTHCKTSDNIDNANKYCTKRVLFTNDNNKKYGKLNKLKERKKETCSNMKVIKDKSYVQNKGDINEICNNHNTTESFVLWEKACKTSDKLLPRRSHSFSELNFIAENYTGDDEYSTSFKTLDNTYMSDIGFDPNDKSLFQKKYSRYRSQSCDSLLREVKHLPHILYDRFLKCLAKEIEMIRRQNIICTCPNLNQKHSNKENSGRNSRSNMITPMIKISNEKVEKTKSSFKSSPVKLVTNTNHSKLSVEKLKNLSQDLRKLSAKSINKIPTTPTKKYNMSKLSPEPLKNLPQDVHKLSPKPLNKTPTTPSKKRGLYSWQKEIVSPVGEYIRGKRQSPFKTSPNKKK